MAIKQSTSTTTKTATNILKARLENIQTEEFFVKLTPYLQEKINTLIKETTHYNHIEYDDMSPQQISGESLNAEKILAIIIQATGYNKWELDNITKQSIAELDDIKEEYNIMFDEKIIYQYTFTRPTNHRNDVNLISVIALPNYNQAEIQTGRTGYFLDILVTDKELLDELSKDL